MLPAAKSESADFADWAWPMVLKCLRGCCYGIFTATILEFLFRVGLINPEARFIVDFLITSAVIGVIGTIAVCVLYLCVREDLGTGSDS